jgi:hypothetical protein
MAANTPGQIFANPATQLGALNPLAALAAVNPVAALAFAAPSMALSSTQGPATSPFGMFPFWGI